MYHENVTMLIQICIDDYQCTERNDTLTRSVAPPARWICQISNGYIETCRKSIMEIIAKIPKIWFWHKTQILSSCVLRATYVLNVNDLSWFMRPWLKKRVWSNSGNKLGYFDLIVMELKVDLSCYLLNVYTKFQIDISKHVEKVQKLGRTDGQKDIGTA